MNDSELSFFTTQQLIAELMRRTTFLGVVVQAEDEFKTGRWPAEQVFKVHFNENLKSAEAARLLEVVANYIDHQDIE